MSVITETYRDTITVMRKHFDRGGEWFNVGIEGKENWSYQAVEKYSPVGKRPGERGKIVMTIV